MSSEKEKLIQGLMKEGYLKTPGIIDAFRVIDRKDFVLPEYRSEAYGNYPLPIGYGQTISQPLTVAFMLELLDPREGEKILDIGAGSGWTTALLSQIVGSSGGVFSIERIPELCAFAKSNLEKYGFLTGGKTQFFCQDATAEIPDGPYDKIIAAAAIAPGSPSSAASQDIPDEWRRKLKVGGRIVAPIGGSIWRFIKKSEIEWKEEEFSGFAFVPLVTDNQQPTTYNQFSVTDNLQLTTYNWWMWRVIVLCGLLLVVSFWLLVWQVYWPHADFRGSKSITIEQGLGSRKIGKFLKQEGVIDSKWAFVTYVSLKGIASDLKPGFYIWNDTITIPELVRDLRRGGTNERAITIPEGWTTREIAEYFFRENIASQNDFLRLVGKDGVSRFRADFSFLADAPKNTGLEGYLFPDTYRIFRDASLESIVVKMLANFDRKLTADLREEITRQKKKIFDIVRMASLIEKEVVSVEDRALVAGVLWKRLRLDIPLQVDATVVYAKSQISNLKSQISKVTIEDTKIDSPYNTYKYYGLPPGPIANPGISAIRAALYPQESEYFYYLSAPDGRTIFSRTLEEHNAAVRKYLTK
ncbi:MAG: endolytic transglycosylase MltG [Candidatus Liptonbacteria bacterium]|nr:endolytic transglycosylase MltG [Candidatus Liptonbacteria bacterium]